MLRQRRATDRRVLLRAVKRGIADDDLRNRLCLLGFRGDWLLRDFVNFGGKNDAGGIRDELPEGNVAGWFGWSAMAGRCLLGIRHGDRISWIFGLGKGEQFTPELSWQSWVLAGVITEGGS